MQGGAASPRAGPTAHLHNMTGGSPPDGPGHRRRRPGSPVGRDMIPVPGSRQDLPSRPGQDPVSSHAAVRRPSIPAEAPPPSNPTEDLRLSRPGIMRPSASLPGGPSRPGLRRPVAGKAPSTGPGRSRSAAVVSVRASGGSCRCCW